MHNTDEETEAQNRGGLLQVLQRETRPSPRPPRVMRTKGDQGWVCLGMAVTGEASSPAPLPEMCNRVACGILVGPGLYLPLLCGSHDLGPHGPHQDTQMPGQQGFHAAGGVASFSFLESGAKPFGPAHSYLWGQRPACP